MIGLHVGPPANFRDLVRRQIARVRGVDISELSFAEDLQKDRRYPVGHPTRGAQYEASCAAWEAMTAEDIWGSGPMPMTAPDVS